MDSLFHPRSIAVIGASRDRIGSFMLNIIVEHGFQGKIYPVNRNGGEVLGTKAYSSLQDIPGPVDYAFIQVPARASVQVIKDCAAKGVKLATLFTAGFSESEIEGGSELEQELVSAARQHGIRFLGPNCMGIYCPAVSLAFAMDFPKESGPVGVLCQSGGNASHIVRAASQHGIRFSKVISYGNAADLNETDILEYLAQDTETKVIIAYIEGVKQGKRFSQVLRATTPIKPVIVLKGGQSEAGAETVISHTGSLAGSREIWDSLLKQAGAVQACDVDECVDIALAFLSMKPPHGRRTAIIGFGGGPTVQAADDCCRAGLTLPRLSEEIKDELKKFTPMAGDIFRNPVDASHIFWTPSDVAHAVGIVGNWERIDLLILHMALDARASPRVLPQMLGPVPEAFIRAAKDVGKPAALVASAAHSTKAYQGVLKVQQMCVESGLPFYPSVLRAGNAIDKLIRYYQARG